MQASNLISSFFQRTLRSVQRIYTPCRCQHVQNQAPLVVERALRSIKMDAYDTSLVRNFCIIAHVDHGSSFFICSNSCTSILF